MTKARNFQVDHSHLVSHETLEGRLIFEENNTARMAVEELKRLSLRAELPVLAYCFLKRRVFLLFGPIEDPTAISSFMKSLTRSITDGYNRHHGVQGSLWRERFQIWPVRPGQTEQVVMRYIERLPVREGTTWGVHLYPFSSYAERKNDQGDNWLCYPDALWQRCRSHQGCLTEYRDFVKIGPDESAISMIETAMLHEDRVIGDDDRDAAQETLLNKVADDASGDGYDSSEEE